jgi:GNAT superfamily N-acetyltransferase
MNYFCPMNLLVRKGTKDDMAAVYALVCELALFEKAPEQVITSVEQMQRDGFGEHPVFYSLVAVLEGKIVGAAVYFLKYSTWKGKGVYLDDIVVTESCRGKGIGSALFDALLVETRRLEANQLHWQVLDWNTPAIHFYEKYKAEMDGEWINCKLNFSPMSSAD